VPESSTPAAAGFSLVELLVVLVLTLAVMAAVQQAACVAYHLHAREVRLTERSTIALRAVEEMAREIERAGLGLGGDVVAILPGAPGSSADSDGITIRSSPDALMAVLQSDVRPGQDRALVAGASLFQPGERVFLTDTTGPPIPAVVVDADSRTLTLRDMAPPTGPPRRSILADRAGRVRRFREVSYFPRDLPGESRPALVRTIDAGPETILARGVEQLRFEYRDDAGRRLNPMRLPRGGPRFVRVRLGLGELRELPAVEASVGLPVHGGSIAFDERRVRLRLREMLAPVHAAVDVGSLTWAEMGWVLFRDSINGGSRAVSYVLERNVRDPRVGSVLDLPDVPPPLALLPQVFDPGCPGCLWLAAESARGLEGWRLRPDPGGAISPISPLDRVLLASEVHAVAGVAAGYEERTLFVAERRSSSVLRVRVGPTPREPIVERLAALRARPTALAAGCEGSLWVLIERERTSDPGGALLEIPLDLEGRPGPARTAARFWGDPRGLAVDPIRGWLYVLVRELDNFVLYELSPDCVGPIAARPRPVFSLRDWREAVQRDPSLLFRVIHPSKGTVVEVKDETSDEADGKSGDEVDGKSGDETGETGDETGVEAADEDGATDGEKDSSAGSDKKKKTKKKYIPYLLLLPTRLSGVAFDGGGSLFLMADDTPVVLRFHVGRPWTARNRAGIAAVPVQERDGEIRLRLLGWAQRPGAGAP
jgi:hypothetical protein